MYKKTFLFLSIITTLMLAFSSCGSDEPDIPRDRDINMSVKALTHVLNTSTQQATIDDKCTNSMVISQKNHTVDFDLHVFINGSERTFTVKNVPYTDVEETSRIAFDQITTSNAEVKNLHGTIDKYDQVLIVQYDISGYHITATIPEVFFSKVSSAFTYSNGEKSEYTPSFWIIKVNPTTLTAELNINDLEIAKDLMLVTVDKEANTKEWKRSGRFFTAINGNGAKVEPTVNGFKLTASVMNTIAYYNGAQGSSSALKTNDYPMLELDANVNLTDGTLAASYTLKHIIARDQDNLPSEWDDINITSNGIVYKNIVL